MRELSPVPLRRTGKDAPTNRIDSLRNSKLCTIKSWCRAWERGNFNLRAKLASLVAAPSAVKGTILRASEGRKRGVIGFNCFAQITWKAFIFAPKTHWRPWGRTTRWHRIDIQSFLMAWCPHNIRSMRCVSEWIVFVIAIGIGNPLSIRSVQRISQALWRKLCNGQIVVQPSQIDGNDW